MRIHFFLLGLLVARGALAEPDAFGFGTGRSGLLRVEAPDTVINRYGLLTAPAEAGAKVLTVSNASAFVAGELVLLHQSTGLLPGPASGEQSAISLAGRAVGRFEYARVGTVAAGTLQLTGPLRYGYAASVTQVVSVPEYTDVEVLAGASLRAAPWDGSVGGILALLATGKLLNEGVIAVDGAGFRGGAFINHPGGDGCTGLDELPGGGGSYKGEGLVAERFGTAAGRGNLATGAGGGVCHNSGGGGGGHAGVGGTGGFTNDATMSRDVGGLGGAPVVYLPYEHFVFGGGGGGGGGHVDSGTAGAAGGGVMLIRAAEVAGQGKFTATGAPADFVPPSTDDGAGGGGAGGLISLRAARGLACGLAQASGGAGGDTRNPTSESGPGGGGGGGVVFLQGVPITCPISVAAGLPGQSTAGGGTFGAGPAQVDSGSSYGFEQTLPVPFRVPLPPALTKPAHGSTGVARQPRIEGTSEPGVVVHLFLDGAPYGQVIPSGTGAFSYTAPFELKAGPHEVRASAELFGSYSPPSEAHRFDVETPGGPSGDEPALVVPEEGEAVDPTPLFAGTSPQGASVSIEVDGAEVGRVPLDAQRRFHHVLLSAQALAPGSHSVIVRAWDAAGKAGLSSPATRFEVKSPEALDVGCGCGASPGAGLGAVALLLGLGASRLRRRE
ncbi:MAG: hemagglutinin [Myxococcaceae bacterium]|nr:hemagglutinin [Myxococcaceae bacterium]